MSSYANIPNIKEQTGWRVSFWFAVSSPLVDVPLGFLGSENASRIQRPDIVMDFVAENTTKPSNMGRGAKTSVLSGMPAKDSHN
jgi:hypothetical protein